MSSKIGSSVERDALRERERQARAQRAGLGAGETGGHPIFRAPIKVDPGQEDEISRRLRSTLGDFSQVQRLLTHDPNHLIGISRTNAALSSSSSSSRGAASSGSSSSSATSAGPVTSAPPGPAPTNGVGSSASTWNGTATDPGGTRVGSSKHHGSSQHQPPQSSHHGGSGSASGHRSHHSSSHHHHSHHHHHKKQQPQSQQHQPPQQQQPQLSNGQYKSSVSASQSTAAKGSRHPHAPQLPPGSHHPRSSQGSSEQGRPDRTEENPPVSDRPKPAAPPPNGLVVRPPAMRVPSKDVNNGTTSASHSSSNTSSSLTVKTESNGPANSGGKAAAPARSMVTPTAAPPVEAKAKRPPPPRLQLPVHATDAAPCAAHPELESILKEMKKVPPALTAIETPRKEDCRPYFPPSPVQEAVLNHLDENGDSKSLLDSRKVASPPGSSLQDDLEMSDSDDEQEPPFRKSSSSLGISSSKVTPPNEKVLQPPPLVEKMSSSESSSSDSDDSSSASGSESESESSESEASAPETSREPSTQSWKLANFIDKRSSPAALGAVLPSSGCPGQSRGANPCDSLVDEDSFIPILSQFPNQDPDLGLMLKSPSPQGLDLVRSPVGKAASFLSPVHSSPSRSPPLDRHEPPEPAPKSSAVPVSSDDEGPCQLQNGRITMRLGKPQGKLDQETPPPKPDPQPDPTVKRGSWPSKGSKKETAQLPLPTAKQRVKPEPKPEPAKEPAPSPVQTTSNPSKRTHSDRYNEKRSKLHKPRVVLSDSSSDDEGPNLAAAVKERLSSSAPTANEDRSGKNGERRATLPPQRGRPKSSSSSSRTASSKVHKGGRPPPAPVPGVPRTPPEPPMLLSPIGQRCRDVVDGKESASATDGVVVVNIPLSRLLRPPGRSAIPGRRPPSPPPSPSRSREHSRDAEPGVVASATKPEPVRVKQEPPASPAASKGKSTSKRKSTSETGGCREKKRRLSASSSGSLKVKQEPSDVRPEEEAESRHAWGPQEPHRSCGSPSSLSSYSSQRSGSRQHRSKPSSGKTNRSDKSAVRRDAAPTATTTPADPANGGKKNHHHHHREKKETSRSSKDGALARSGVVEERSSDPTGSGVAAGVADPLCSSQVHSWVLSSSEQGDARSRDASGGKAASLGAPVAGVKVKEEPRTGSNPHLLSHNSHREWESKNGSSDYFLSEAKKLKHQADREGDRTVQAMKYLEAVLYFILTGSSMEHSHHEDNAYMMYKETLALIRHISSKFQKVQGNDVIASIDNKLAVLSLRCLSLLYEKLYKLRKNEVRDNMRLLHDLQKTQGSVGKLSSPTPTTGGAASRLQPSPCQPSPHSPTPSPAGSVGSQSSGYSSCELGNTNNGGSGRNPGAHQPSASQAAVPSVAVPQAQYTLLQRQSATLANLHHCHDKWEQADYLTNSSHSKDFFAELDRDCGKLTLHSSSAELVNYVREGVCRLKHRLPAATAAPSATSSAEGST